MTLKNLHLHAGWAIVAFALAAAAWVVSARNAGSGPSGPARVDSRAEAALRARVAELEAERAALGNPSPARLPESPAAAPKEEDPKKPAILLSVDQIRALIKSAKKEDVARAIQEIEAMTDRRQKLALLRAMVESGDRGLLYRAVSMLRKIQDPESVSLLSGVLAAEGPPGPRWQAALALGDLGDPSAIGALRDAFGSSDLEIRSAAAYALDKFGQPEPAREVTQTLAGMLQSSDGGTRIDVVDLLDHIPMPDSLSLLVSALGDASNSHLREDAADVMGARKMVDALPYLQRALQDPAANVRGAAQKAINRINGSKP
jgi:HEAT repeat protein